MFSHCINIKAHIYETYWNAIMLLYCHRKVIYHRKVLNDLMSCEVDIRFKKHIHSVMDFFKGFCLGVILVPIYRVRQMLYSLGSLLNCNGTVVNTELFLISLCTCSIVSLQYKIKQLTKTNI